MTSVAMRRVQWATVAAKYTGLPVLLEDECSLRVLGAGARGYQYPMKFLRLDVDPDGVASALLVSLCRFGVEYQLASVDGVYAFTVWRKDEPKVTWTGNAVVHYEAILDALYDMDINR